jgi:RNA polymerase sigma-70 factor (ECF subfamily)
MSSDTAGAAEAVAPPHAAFDFDSAFHTHYGRISRVIVRVLGDRSRAEDLAVEAFWRLWRSPSAHNEAHGGWVYRTAVRLALDELRRRARRERYERVLDVFRGPRTPDEAYAATEEQRRVRAVLAVLSRQHAIMLVLQSDGASYDEIAGAASVNPSSVGTLLARARQAFRKEYVKRHGERS